MCCWEQSGTAVTVESQAVAWMERNVLKCMLHCCEQVATVCYTGVIYVCYIGVIYAKKRKMRTGLRFKIRFILKTSC